MMELCEDIDSHHEYDGIILYFFTKVDWKMFKQSLVYYSTWFYILAIAFQVHSLHG